jgi:predicted permease
MEWKDEIRRGFVGVGQVPDQDVIEELAQHAEAAYAQARAEGQASGDAADAVRAQIAGWIERAPELRRRTRRPPVLTAPSTETTSVGGFVSDVRYACRLMRRRPGATAIAVLTMTLGVGATTVLFSVVSGVLLKPLPWPEPDRLVRVTETRLGATQRSGSFLTNGTYLTWRQNRSTIEDIGGWSTETVTLTGAGEPRRIRIASTTPSTFTVLRASPATGAGFVDEEQAADRVLISHALWQEQLGGAPGVPGQAIVLDGRAYTISGVMPAGFAFPDRDTRAWLPMRVPPVVSPGSNGRSISMFNAIARLRPGVSPAQAAEEATARGRQGPDPGLTAVAVFGSKGAVQVSAVPMLASITADVRTALYVLLAAVALLLIAATANLASVQLARATTRSREMAIRAAIGAGTRRLAQQLLIENLITGLTGGAGGLLLAVWLHRSLPAVLPADFPRAAEVGLDWRVALAALALSILAGVLVGLLPALQLRGLSLVAPLTEDGQAPSGARTRTARTRAWIMAGQVAVATVLLVGASLMTRSFSAMLSADRGYVVANILSARLPLPSRLYSGPRRAEILANIVDRLQKVPGVTHAAFTTALPLTGGEQMLAFSMPDTSGRGASVSVHTRLRTVSPDYFAAMGIRVSEGRTFTASDTRSSLPVFIVNHTFARTYFSGSALGRTVPVDLGDDRGNSPTSRQVWHVVGVVDDVLPRSLEEAAQPELYLCFAQLDQGVGGDAALVMRTNGNPSALAPMMRTIVREQDAAIALDSVMSMEERLALNLAKPRLYAIVLVGFAVFATLIAGVGLFGVLSYSVAQRVREIGVRTALGATRGDIVKLVVRQGALVTLAGLAAGILGAFVLTGSMSTFLYGVTPVDPISFTVVPIVLLVVAVAACYVPARRAASVDPLVALRSS